MTEDLPLVATPMPAERQIAVEVLLDDSEWLDAQFAAIMKISGFGDRVVVSTLWRPHDSRPDRRSSPYRGPSRRMRPVVRSSDRRRVRSPPDIG